MSNQANQYSTFSTTRGRGGGGGGEEYDIGSENVTGRTETETEMGIGGAAAASTTLTAAAAAATGNTTTTSLDSQEDSTSCMDGIEWDDESDDEENLGLLFWDEISPGDNTTTPSSASGVHGVVGGNVTRGENVVGEGGDNEIPIINPRVQSAEYMGPLFGMQQNVGHGTNSNVSAPPLCEQVDGSVKRMSPGSALENIVAKVIPISDFQSIGGNAPQGGDVVDSTSNAMGSATAPTTTLGGVNHSEHSAFFPSSSCGSVPSLLEVQEAQQQQAMGIASLGLSALKVAAAATGARGITNGSSVMLPSSLATSSGNDGQSFLPSPNMHPTNVIDQWSAHQMQQQQFSSSMNSLPSQPPSAAVNQPFLGAVAPTSPHPYLMWLLQQQQQVQQAQQQANVLPQVQALPSNPNAGTLNQLQLFQLFQLQQQQQLVQPAASQQQQQQSNLMQASSEQLQSMQNQFHQQQSVNLAVSNSGTTQGWLGNPPPQQPQMKSHPPGVQVSTQQSQGPIKGGRKTRAVVSTKVSTSYKRKRSNQNQSQRREGPHGKSQFAAAAATVAHTPSGVGSNLSTSQYNNNLAYNAAPTTETTSTIQNTAPISNAVATNNMPLVSASDTEGGGQLEWMSDHSQNHATRSSISPNYFYTSAEEFSGTEDHVKFATEEQRVQYNRERNREHAKNTRIRKKAFVEQLKISVDELCRERDSLISERAMAANLMVETHSKRVDVLRSVFALRAGYCFDQKRELWSSILDESSFTCRLPVTPYQSFPSSEVQVSNCQRTIVGVDAMISDAASNYVFLDSIVDRAQYPDGKIKFQYTLVTEESVVAGNQLMARWAMSTLNAKKLGANTELHQSGMLICKFNNAHKIVALEIMFDVMAFMLQVKMAMGFDNFNDVVIPNTVQTCSQKVYDYPMVMTLASRPYTIVQVNDRWEKLTGFTRQEVVGKRSCSILQGRFHHVNNATGNTAAVEEENRKELDKLMGPLMFQRPSCAMLTNYTKFGRRYRQYVTIYPLSTDSNILHYFGLTTFVQWMEDEVGAADVVAGECNDRASCDDDNNNGSLSSGHGTPHSTTHIQHNSKCGTSKETPTSKSSSDNLSSGGGSSTSSLAPPPSTAGKSMSDSQLGKQSSSSLTSSMSNTSSSDDVRTMMDTDQQ